MRYTTIEKCFRSRLFPLGLILYFGTLVVPSESLAQASKEHLIIGLSADFQFNQLSGNSLENAVYDTKMTHPIGLNLTVGTLIGKFLYLGMRYDYWLGNSSYTLGGSNFKETLNVQSLGPEIGYMGGNPRSFYHLLLGVRTPLVGKIVRNSNEVFSEPPAAALLSVRAGVGIKMNPFSGLMLEGGYQKASLGVFRNAQGEALWTSQTGALDVDLSHFFGSLGIFFWF